MLHVQTIQPYLGWLHMLDVQYGAADTMHVDTEVCVFSPWSYTRAGPKHTKLLPAKEHGWA